jgi:hypothetical protein
MNSTQCSFGDILGILKTRTTAWAHDRLIIAVLLTLGLSLPPNALDKDIILGIVSKIDTLTLSFLLYGHNTITNKGLFSWCPANIFHLHIPPYERTGFGDFKVVRKSGNSPEVAGFWKAWLLDDPEGVVPYSFHPSVELKVRAALTSPETCLLLREDSALGPPTSYPAFLATFERPPANSDEADAYDQARAQAQAQARDPVLLVNTIDLSKAEGVFEGQSFIDCQYVGTVMLNRGLPKSSKTFYARTRLGKEWKKLRPAQEVVQEYREVYRNVDVVSDFAPKEFRDTLII